MAHERIIPLRETNNFRDLGGYQTKDGRSVCWHRIYRADDLSKLASDDQAKMLKLRIKEDIDLRSHEECSQQSDRIPDQIRYIFNPVFRHDETQSTDVWTELEKKMKKEPFVGKQQMIKAYANMVNTSNARKAFQRLFEHLLSLKTDDALVFHCTAGKDLTGFSAYLILSALGVDQQTIIKDYMLTNTALMNYLHGQTAALRAGHHNETEIANYTALWTADKAYLRSAIQALKDNYGDLMGFLTEGLHLSANDINDLKKMYLQ